MMQEIKDRLRAVLVKSLALDIEPSAVPERDLVKSLGLNSINTIEFLIWVETEFDIEIADEDLSVDLIDDLDQLAQYVVERGGGPSVDGNAASNDSVTSTGNGTPSGSGASGGIAAQGAVPASEPA